MLVSFEETFRPYGLPYHVISPSYGLAEHTVFLCGGGIQRLLVDKEALEKDNSVRVIDELVSLDENDGSVLGATAQSNASIRTGGDEEVKDAEVSTTVLIGCGFPARERPVGVEAVEVVIVGIQSEDEIEAGAPFRRVGEDSVGEIWVRSPSKAQVQSIHAAASLSVLLLKLRASLLLCM